MRAGGAAGQQGRLGGLNGDDVHVRVLLLENLRDARDGAARANAGDEDVNLAVGVGPDLLAGVRHVGGRVSGVGELGGDDRAGTLGGDALGLGDSGGDAALRVGEDQLGAECAHDRAALDGHRGGHDDDDLVAACRAHHRQGDTRVTGGGLDDRAAGSQGTRGLGCFDDRTGDAILHGGGGVEGLNLGDHVDAVAGNVVNADERGAADQISDGGGDASHEGSFLSRCTPELSSRARSFV